MKKWILAAITVLFLVGCNDNTAEEELAQYEEYEILNEKLDLSIYEVEVETDNSGNRVLIFSEDDGVKSYKSIFVKDEQHLKIVSMKNEELLYNDVIK